MRLSPSFYLWHLLLPAGLALLLLFAYPQQWDMALIRPFYVDSSHSFVWRDHFLLSAVLHSGLKSALWLVPLVVLGMLLAARHFPELLIHRRRLLWILLGMSLSVLVVQILKRNSIHACPWDLQQFGGQAPLLPLWAALPSGVSPGRCLPGGHASGGFALLAFYFALRDDAQRWARACLYFALAIGGVMSLSQMVRGAHFLSHNLWTLWWVWSILALRYMVWPPIPHVKLQGAPQ